MPVGNISFVKDFVIIGFPGLQPHHYAFVSALLFFVYVCTLAGNAIFFILFVMTKSLQKPVYYCIINLVVCDVLFQHHNITEDNQQVLVSRWNHFILGLFCSDVLCALFRWCWFLCSGCNGYRSLCSNLLPTSIS